MSERYQIIRCEAEGAEDLAIIWDRLEEQVIEVISAKEAARHADEQSLWDQPA